METMKKQLFIASLSFALASIPIVAPLFAQALQGHNVNAPFDFDADKIEVQDRADRVVLTGNVHVRQEGLSLNAARMTLAYNKVNGGSPQVDRVEAQGGVIVTETDKSATGDVAIYDAEHKLITMIGGVKLKQGTNILSGGRLVIDLVSGRDVMDGSSVGSSNVTNDGAAISNGRVSGHFTVPQRKP